MAALDMRRKRTASDHEISEEKTRRALKVGFKVYLCRGPWKDYVKAGVFLRLYSIKTVVTDSCH